MDITYKKAESTVKPLEIDITSSPNGVYIRRNIKEFEKETDNGTATYYDYEEAFVSKSEYEQVKNDLLVEQINGEDNTAEYLAYKEKLNTPVLYEENNHYYKPKWASSFYENFISKSDKFPELFPMSIWDATGDVENVEKMTADELKNLVLFLVKVQEEYYYEYKLSKIN